MVKIKEQCEGLGQCVQKVKVSQGIIYPDVSSCLTLTGILKDYFVGAHVGLMDKVGEISENTISQIMRQINNLKGNENFTNTFVIGWIGIWKNNVKTKYDKIIGEHFKTGWFGNLDEVRGVNSSSEITFDPGGKIFVQMRGENREWPGYKIPASWEKPGPVDEWFYYKA